MADLWAGLRVCLPAALWVASSAALLAVWLVVARAVPWVDLWDGPLAAQRAVRWACLAGELAVPRVDQTVFSWDSRWADEMAAHLADQRACQLAAL